MGDRTNLIIGLLLLAAIVAFVVELCDTGPVDEPTEETDHLSTASIGVTTPAVQTDQEVPPPDGSGDAIAESEVDTAQPPLVATPPEQPVIPVEEADPTPPTPEPTVPEEPTPPVVPSGTTPQRSPEETDTTENEPAPTATREVIRQAFTDFSPEFRVCYELLLELEPEASDRLVFSLNVTADPEDETRGVVELVSISSSSLVLEDTACFAEAIVNIELPPPPPDTDLLNIRYPVVLHLSP